MAQRKRIGIIYSYNEDWIGGAYYIQNLIKSLRLLPKNEQPLLRIITKNEATFKDLQKSTQYSKLTYLSDTVSYNAIEKFINKVAFKLFGKKIIVKKIKLDWIFPLYTIPSNFEHITHKVFWIPDLQEKYLPHFFTDEEVNKRDEYCKKMVEENYPIVFSSQTALKDFEKFYSNSKNKKYVIPFAVIHPDLSLVHIDEVRNKYQIQGDYFISPNQFWQHKNHIVIIEAAKILKEKDEAFKIVFTGKEYDYRNPEYTDFLKQKVKEYNLENEILFLGFIDRIDQLVLMKNAQAVIQPSFFEGWSTVVEDAKALNQCLIVSNIDVHKEQLHDQAHYFDPTNSNSLATILKNCNDNKNSKIYYSENYEKNVLNFANNLKIIINN